MVQNSGKFHFLSIRLTKYISALFARDLLMMFLAVFFVILVIDTIELIRISSGAQHINNAELLKLAFLKNYSTVSRVLPFVVLLATFKTYCTLYNNFEMVGAYSIGVSKFQLLIPALLVLSVFITIHLSFFLPVSSYFMTMYQKFDAEMLHTDMGSIHAEKNGLWLRQREQSMCSDIASYGSQGIGGNVNNGGTYIVRHNSSTTHAASLHNKTNIEHYEVPYGTAMIIHASKIDHKNSSLVDVEIIVLDENGAFSGRIRMPALYASGKTWTATGAEIIDVGYNTKDIHDLKLCLSVSFNDLSMRIALPESVNIWGLPKFIRFAQDLGFNVSTYHIYFWHTLLRPIFMLVMLIFSFTAIHIGMRKSTGYMLATLLMCGLLMYFGNELLIMALLYKMQNYVICIGLPYMLLFTTTICFAMHHRGG